MSKPKLYVMCGLSGSGKSTIAKQIVNDNPDTVVISCLLYTSDAADEEDSVDLGGRLIIKKKKRRCYHAS